ncbi:hypothetical protein ACCUM_2121 [Candidatus Accumulibacter phosphatis]|uniref:Uncharacterized protein n=1 Tax=Candidatus Accumulibacter phosphatis TaxID=327160 RepID=A0A5S4ERS9_9PROT|nr:hypothetical protein ACCUM_2121 [Candidatus Accumulibacter phosphatis]
MNLHGVFAEPLSNWNDRLPGAWLCGISVPGIDNLLAAQ